MERMLTALQVAELAQAMSHPSAPMQSIDAGYTYFGQLIAHDLVAETRGGGRSVSPSLDLDSIYGAATGITTPLDERGSFPLATSGIGGVLDLPRMQGVAQIPERRNDDNVLVAQLHLFWLRFHNFLLARGHAGNALQARRQVIQIFQLLVVEDYLRLVLAPQVFDSYFRKQQRWLTFHAPIPMEFSHAVFRFGHSMVRPFYEAFPREPSDVPLAELFRPNQSLPADLCIDWRHFFGWPVPGNHVQDAMAIGPNITEHMASIPVPSRGPGARVDIVQVNLEAGMKARLAPGKWYVEQLLKGPRGSALRDDLRLVPLEDLGVDLAARLPLSSGINIDNLPLWPYVLVEAARDSEGRHLGVFGSMVCAEVLLQSMVTAQESICPQGVLRGADSVLASLGSLGRAIERVRSTHRDAIQIARPAATPDAAERTFCKRHLVELLAGSA